MDGKTIEGVPKGPSLSKILRQKEDQTMGNKDPWLYYGCPCEVWEISERKHKLARLVYFHHADSMSNYFSIDKWDNDLGESSIFFNYCPINTPWDYSPHSAIEIIIDTYGLFKFKLDDGHIWFDDIAPCWDLCPDHLKGHTWERPDWAKVR
jgi:hypothetical protein